MKAKVIFLVLRVALLMVLGWMATVSSAFAGGVVTDCSNDAQFDSMLAGGGTITFNCGPALINLSSTKTISAETTIDGGGKITLSGVNDRRLFGVNAGATLTLSNIILTNGFSPRDGGAIGNDGTLILKNSTIRNSQASASGGAIVSYGPLVIINSVLEGNKALNGGALYPRFSAAQTLILDSMLRNNTTIGPTPQGLGGAILAWDGAPVTIVSSDIHNNTALQGGAIYNWTNSVLVMVNSRLRDNSAVLYGGGIRNQGTVTLADVTLSGNSATDSLVGGGGGISNGGMATLDKVTVSGNSARDMGGGIFNAERMTLTNVTLSGNSAPYGGAIHNGDTATLTNVTLSGNSAMVKGGGLNNEALITVKNTIVANSPKGGNCSGGISTNGFNLSSDNTCGFAAGENNVNVMFGPLADNGGPTQTHLLQPGSPAIDHGSGCPATDQRGVARPVGAACDIGAVEYREVVSAPDSVSIYLPLVLR